MVIEREVRDFREAIESGKDHNEPPGRDSDKTRDDSVLTFSGRTTAPVSLTNLEFAASARRACLDSSIEERNTKLALSK